MAECPPGQRADELGPEADAVERRKQRIADFDGAPRVWPALEAGVTDECPGLAADDVPRKPADRLWIPGDRGRKPVEAFQPSFRGGGQELGGSTPSGAHHPCTPFGLGQRDRRLSRHELEAWRRDADHESASLPTRQPCRPACPPDRAIGSPCAASVAHAGVPVVGPRSARLHDSLAHGGRGLGRLRRRRGSSRNPARGPFSPLPGGGSHPVRGRRLDGGPVPAPLARAGVSVLPIATFDTDYVLIREADAERSVAALHDAGCVIEDSDVLAGPGVTAPLTPADGRWDEAAVLDRLAASTRVGVLLSSPDGQEPRRQRRAARAARLHARRGVVRRARPG